MIRETHKAILFYDPRVCEAILFVPGCFEVASFIGEHEGKTKTGYRVNFEVDALERFAEANRMSRTGAYGGAGWKVGWEVFIEKSSLEKICRHCFNGDIPSAERLAIQLYKDKSQEVEAILGDEEDEEDED